MKHTFKSIEILSMLEDINLGGCGVAALVIANSLRKDGYTPEFRCDVSITKGEKHWIENFDHIVVYVTETGECIDALGFGVPDRFKAHELPEAQLRKFVRDRSVWNKQFDRNALRIMKCYMNSLEYPVENVC